jgi:hypothetical protein
MSKLDTYYQNKQKNLIEQHAAVLTDKTYHYLRLLDSIDKDPQDTATLRDNLERLKDLSQDYVEVWQDFVEAFERTFDDSLAFSFSWNQRIALKRENSEITKSTQKRIDDMRQIITSKLNEILLAEREIVRKIQTRLKDNSYYVSSVDGLYGAGTIAAIESFSDDINQPVAISNKAEVLQTVKNSFLQPVGPCLKTSADGAFLACFSLE